MRVDTVQLLLRDWPPLPRLCSSGKCAHAEAGNPCPTKARLAKARQNAAKRIAAETALERASSAGALEPWDVAEFQCGTCGAHVKATTERAYVDQVAAHRALHAKEDQE